MATSSYQGMLGSFAQNMTSPDESKAAEVQKAKRPLKMPKGYDFSVRNVNWNQYKNDYILRTDAVWEKSKLLDLFYTHYKSKISYDYINNQYMVANIRQMPLPTSEPEHYEDWRPFLGYSEIDGCVWQFKTGPKL